MCVRVRASVHVHMMHTILVREGRHVPSIQHVRVCVQMRRYNKATDLINRVADGKYDLDPADAFSRIYAWLRYSATRKLTWQRNYNTQPRILSGAQDRLTNTIASVHARTAGALVPWAHFCCVPHAS